MGKQIYLARTQKPKNPRSVKRTSLEANGVSYTVIEPYTVSELRNMAKQLGTRVRKSSSVEQTRRRLARKDVENRFGLRAEKDKAEEVAEQPNETTSE